MSQTSAGSTKRQDLAGSLAAVLLALALAAAWVVQVPLLQSADESVHLDYVFAIYSQRGLVNVRQRALEPYPDSRAHPFTAYLVERTGFRQVIHHRDVPMPAAYWRPGYLASLDAEAPQDPGPRQRLNPGLVAIYPFGYYALAAAWMGGAHLLGAGLVEMVYAVRLLSVLLLGVGVWLGYRLCRALGAGPHTSLAVALIAGCLPVSSFVGSYAQPDNLAFALVNGVLLGAVAMTSVPSSRRATVLTAAALGVLAVTKYQFWLCVAIPIAAQVWARRLSLRSFLLLLLPSAGLGAIQVWVGWGAPHLVSSTVTTLRWTDQAWLSALHAGPWAAAGYLASEVVRAFVDFNLLGTGYVTFWGVFGWVDMPLLFGNLENSIGLWLAIAVIGLFVIGLTSIRGFRLAALLAGRVRRRGLAAAAPILAANPAVTTYLLFTGFMFAVYAYTDDSFDAQGRNWFPVMFPWLLTVVAVASRGFRRQRWRRIFTGLILAGLLLYSFAGQVVAPGSIATRYHSQTGAADQRPGQVPATRLPT